MKKILAMTLAVLMCFMAVNVTALADDGHDILVDIFDLLPSDDFDGWMEIEGAWYFFETGDLITNAWRDKDGTLVYLGEDGALVTSDWVQDGDKQYYVGA
ncbi:MAG: hypothetical protein J6L00_03370, partial [Clostridia bacterium]|nr:hypothetical protein [Clostridia bacterium]